MIIRELCINCDKAAVCKIVDMLHKFSDTVKTPLGVNITMNSCLNYVEDTGEITDDGDEDTDN